MSLLTDAIDLEYNGDAAQAMLAIARQYNIAIAYLTREQFADFVAEHRGDERPLTDEEWERLSIGLERYDEFVDETTGPTLCMVPREFMRNLLHRYEIEPPHPDAPWEETAGDS